MKSYEEDKSEDSMAYEFWDDLIRSTYNYFICQHQMAGLLCASPFSLMRHSLNSSSTVL
jgi:hypothetical protein